MFNNKYKRWQWWVCVLTLSPLIILVYVLSFIGSVLELIGEKLNFINNVSTPKFITKFVRWGNGK